MTHDMRAWRLATLFATATLVCATLLLIGFDRNSGGGYQFVVRIPWLPFGSDYRIGVDGLSMPLVVLNALLSLSAIAGSWRISHRQPLYFSLFLILEIGRDGRVHRGRPVPVLPVLGARADPDVPDHRHLGRRPTRVRGVQVHPVHGRRLGVHARRHLPGACFGPKPLTFGIPEIAAFNFAQYGTGIASLGGIAFILLFIGFAVKVPMFPFHTWLPDAHVEAPTAVSVMLAGVLLKMGGYGMLRLCVTLLPQAAHDWQWLLIILAVVNIIYGAFVALAQTDLKKMIAYSSVSHMGYVCSASPR